MRFLGVMVLALVASVPIQAAFLRLPAGAGSAGRCDAVLLSGGDPYSCWVIPGAFSFDATCVAAHWSPGVFGMRELQLADAAVEFSRTGWHAAIGARSLGGDLYREGTVHLVAGAEVADRLDVGLGASLNHLGISGYGTCLAIGFDAGVRCRPVDQVMIGLSVLNANRPMLGRSGERLPTECIAALEYRFVPAWGFFLLASQEERHALECSAAIEGRIGGPLTIRAGAREAFTAFGFGVALRAGAWSLEYAAEIHSPLGITHHCGICLEVD